MPVLSLAGIVYALGARSDSSPRSDIAEAAAGVVEIIAYKVAAGSKTEAGDPPGVAHSEAARGDAPGRIERRELSAAAIQEIRMLHISR